MAMLLFSFISDIQWKFNLFPSWLATRRPPWSCYIQLINSPDPERLSSHLNVWYLDDGALGGSAENVLKDLETIMVEFEKLGLSLNYSKCELFLSSHVSEERKIDILKKFEFISPDIRKFDFLVKNIENIKPHMALDSET
jgi:hypothetical protein